LNTIETLLENIIRQNIANAKKHIGNIVRQEASGAHTNIQYESFNFEEANLSDDLKKKLNEDYSEVKLAIIRSAQMIYLNSVIINAPQNPMQSPNLKALIQREASNIQKYLKGYEEYYVEVTIFTELDRGFSVPPWSRVIHNIYEMTVKAHQSGIAPSEYLSRMFHSSTFSKPLSDFANPTPEGVIDEVELFVLSLSLGLVRPITLDDVSITAKYWKYNPSRPFHFPKMWGQWNGSTRDASSNKFWAQNLSNSFMQPEGPEEATKCQEWNALLQISPGARHPLGMILRGVWNIFSSSNNPIYISKNQCLSGITDILHGMEGLTRKSNMSEDNQYRLKFQNSWKKIIETIAPYHKDTRSSRKVTERLYSLRNTVAHGGVDTLSSQLKNLKLALGDSWNRTHYDIQSTSFELARWVLHVLQAFRKDKNLLKEFYSKEKYNHENRFKKKWNRLVSSLYIN